MPQVGDRHYAYTPGGMDAAKKEAIRTGKKVTSKKPAKKRGIASAMKGASYGTAS